MILLLLLATSTKAQGVLFVGTAQYNANGIVKVISNATITACAAAATGTPCSPTIPIYKDVLLSNLISGSVVTADANGNFRFYLPGATVFTYSTMASGVVGQIQRVTLPGSCPPGVVCVDGNTYPYTAQGILNAITAVGASGGVGGAVQIGSTVGLSQGAILAGRTNILVPSGICILGASRNGTWVQFQAGGGFTFAGVQEACIKHMTVQATVGSATTLISMTGNSTNAASRNVVDDVACVTNSLSAGPTCISLAASGGPAYVFSNTFQNLYCSHVWTCITSTNDEANHFIDIQIEDFNTSGNAANFSSSYDDKFIGRIAGTPTSGYAFALGGNYNDIHLTCDIGSSSSGCINESTSRGNGHNSWNISLVNPSNLGSVAPTSELTQETLNFVRSQTPALLATGTQSVSGCSLSSAAGGAWAGKFASGTTGTCTVTITPGITAPNGWTCDAHDLTTPANVINQTRSTTTTCTISGPTSLGDVITWKGVAF